MATAPPQQLRTPHGAKAAEVYGIVGYLLSLVTFGMRPAFRADTAFPVVLLNAFFFALLYYCMHHHRVPLHALYCRTDCPAVHLGACLALASF